MYWKAHQGDDFSQFPYLRKFVLRERTINKKRFVILAIVIGKLSFNTLAVTLSGLRALFDCKDLLIFPTSFSITG